MSTSRRPRFARARSGWGLAILVVGLGAITALAVDIQPVYNPNITAAQRAVIDAKVLLWEGRLPHQSPEHVVTITFANGNLGTKAFLAGPGVEPVRADIIGLRGTEATTLGVTTGFTNNADGRPTGATITLNNNSVIPWYTGLDPNVPAGQYDLWTVVNHEMEHALGFTVNNPRFARNVTAAPDPNDPNAPLDPNGPRRYTGGTSEGAPSGTLTPRSDGTHMDPNAHPGDLMGPTIPAGTRRAPSPTDIGILLDDVWKYPAIRGTLSNFDVWNRSGLIANDFMVTLRGVLSSSIRSIYNGESCPFPSGHAESTSDGTVVKWGPGPGQVNPGQMGHFGFRIAGGLTPLSYTFEWTQNNVVIATVPVNAGTWRTLTGGKAPVAPLRFRITNETSGPFWIQRNWNFSMLPIVLDDLLMGMPLSMTAMPIDPGPVMLMPQATITYDYLAGVPDGAWAVVMVTNYFEDAGGVPGMLLGTWLDAAELPNTSPPGDLTGDGIVDWMDQEVFAMCLAGPEVYVPPPGIDPLKFALADLSGDGDVDLEDYALLQLQLP